MNHPDEAHQPSSTVSRSELLHELNSLAGISSENRSCNTNNNVYNNTPHNRTKQANKSQTHKMTHSSEHNDIKIDYLSTVPHHPTIKFSRQSRFQPNTSQFGSTCNNTELLCTESPGPKYNPLYTHVLKRVTHGVSWNQSRLQQLRDSQSLSYNNKSVQYNNTVPLLYPNIDVLASKPTPPRAVLGTSKRFINDTTPCGASQSTSILLPNYTTVEQSAPAYSFANPLCKSYHTQPRTAFMTHSINGGLARSATLECSIGPGDYNPIYDTVAYKSQQVTRNLTKFQNMGSAPRYVKPPLVTSPGPIYGVQNGDISDRINKINKSNAVAWNP